MDEKAPCAAETRPWIERPVLSLLPGDGESVVFISGGTLACIGVGDGVVWQGYLVFGEVVEVFGLRSRVRLVHGEGPPPPAPKRVRVSRWGVPPEPWPAEP